MEEIFKIIQKLESIRDLPQFIFFAGIRHSSAIKVREEINRFIKKNPDKKEIDIILESPGGSADHAYILIRTLREHFEKVNVVVPFWAKSAATLFALGGSTIIMDEFGQFGPLDVQIALDDELPESEPQSGLIDEYSLVTIENRALALYQRMLQRLLKKTTDPKEVDIRIKKTVLSSQLFHYIADLYRPLFEKIDPYQIGEKARSLAIAERYAERILHQYNKENLRGGIDYFVDYMVHECPDHGYNIDYSIMNLFLSNVKKSQEISTDYYEALTELSLNLFTHPGEYTYIGFFDNKLLAKRKKDSHTDSQKVGSVKDGKKGEKNENPKPSKQTQRFNSK